MSAVFVHGVPDTYRLWNDVRSQLSGIESVALALPGFDATVPHGFKADKDDYVAWIIGQLERNSNPVDLVGHDWGCIFALRVASLRPDLVRTVAVGSGPVSRDYEWHSLAKTWQTEGDGEAFMRKLDHHSLSDMLQALGVPRPAATSAAEHVDDRMKECILKLYRSAIHVGDEWQASLSTIDSPTLIFWGRHDKECPVTFAHQMASRLANGQIAELDCRHWVPLERPTQLAALLQRHWRGATKGSIEQ